MGAGMRVDVHVCGEYECGDVHVCGELVYMCAVG